MGPNVCKFENNQVWDQEVTSLHRTSVILGREYLARWMAKGRGRTGQAVYATFWY